MSEIQTWFNPEKPESYSTPVSKTAFEIALEDFGIKFKINSRSIILQECPCCSKRWKVWMFRPDARKLNQHFDERGRALDRSSGRTGGQCWSCGTRFSSYTLLRQYGFSDEEVRRKLRIGRFSPDLDPDNWKIDDFQVEEEKVAQHQEIKEAAVPEHFSRVSSWPDHPAAVYAKSRGVTGFLADSIFIDPFTNAVAFPIVSDGVFVGFQSRYVTPADPKMKIKTDAGVPRISSLICVGDPTRPVCVVEGPFDAVAASWMGFYGVATLGKVVTRTQVQDIAAMAMEVNPDRPHVFIGMDQDEPGEQGARVLAKLFDAFGIGFTRILPKTRRYNDFNELLKSEMDLSKYDQIPCLTHTQFAKEIVDWAWDAPMISELNFSTMKVLLKSQVEKYQPRLKKTNKPMSWKDYKGK